MIKKLLVLTMVVLLCACPFALSQEQQPVAKNVGLLQLLTNPDKYEGQVVNVVGYLRLEPEGNILYLTPDDYLNAVPENGIWVDVTPDIAANRSRLDRKYVQLLGKFTTRKLGNSLGAGSLTRIQKATVWSDPDHPRRQKSTKGSG